MADRAGYPFQCKVPGEGTGDVIPLVRAQGFTDLDEIGSVGVSS